MKHGKGIEKLPSGESYNGNFVEGSKYGKGHQKYEDGSEYIGDWMNNVI